MLQQILFRLPVTSVLATAVIMAPQAFGELLVNPVAPLKASQAAIGASFVKSKIDYEISESREIERTIFALEAQYGVKSNIEVFAQFGFINKMEYENVDEDGDGTMLGAGVRGTFLNKGPWAIQGYGLLNFTNEEIDTFKYRGIDVKVKIDLTEFEGGVIAEYNSSNEFSFYGGIALVPYSDGDVKVTASIPTYSESGSHSIERDDLVALRLGAQFAPSAAFVIHGGLAFMSETTFMGGAIYRF